MKVMLLYPRFEPNTNPPMGMAYIAAVLLQNGVDVEFLDPTFDSKGAALERLARSEYDLLGIGAFTMNFNAGLEFARLAKRTRPSCATVFGGVHPTVMYEDVIRRDAVDFVVRGEGEFAVLELVRALESGSPLDSIDGLVHKKEGRVVVNAPRKPFQPLDALPFPARRLLPMPRYLTAGFGRTAWAVPQPATTILTSRGCPFSCTYCSSHLLFGRTVRHRSVDGILSEIEHLKETYGIRGLSIVDDTFIMGRKFMLEFAEKMSQRRLGVEFVCNGRVDTVDREVMRALKSAGCAGIAFGVESGNQRVLDSMKKGITIDQVKRAFHWAWEAGIPTDGYFMIGTPGETEEEIAETVRFSRTLRASAANFSIVVPMPGTEMHDLALKHGTIEVDGLDDYNYASGKAVFRSRLVAPERLREIRRKAVLSFYFNAGFLWDQVLSVRSPGDLQRKIKGFLMLLRSLVSM